MGLLRQPTSDITKGVIWKQLLAFFFPLWFGTFFQQLYNTVDYGQAQPQALSIPLLFSLVVLVKNMGLDLFRHADAGVGYLNSDLLRSGL